MKITAILENTISAGGGFSQSLSAILQIKKLCDIAGYELMVLTSDKDNVKYLKSVNVNCSTFKVSFFRKFYQSILENNSFLRKTLDFLYKRDWIYPIERVLTKKTPDILYFLQPSRIPRYLKKINFIYTVWDVGHRDFPEFPEVRKQGTFLDRENAYKNILPAAYLTITDSNTLSNRLEKLYNLDIERLLAIPFNINPLLIQSSSGTEESAIEKYNLEEGYLFYPAQFWPHKNHIRILQAVLQLKKKNHKVSVVFVGGDKLNKSLIENFIVKNNLGSEIKILGFVTTEELKSLYLSCTAVIMPTYFGPTNIPPFEAWSYEKPLIYSSHLISQVGDAAICVNPDSAEDLANAIINIFKESTRKNLIDEGKKRLVYYDNLRDVAEKEFLNKLVEFEQRSNNWH